MVRINLGCIYVLFELGCYEDAFEVCVEVFVVLDREYFGLEEFVCWYLCVVVYMNVGVCYVYVVWF